jgi:cobalamin biosynthesis protein CobW
VPTLPVTIFTGFLGSGKTTLLASLLAAERDARFAIVVNEFGEVSVDDVLLQQAHDAHRASVFTLTKGLIAYTGDDFIATMLAISGDARRFDHVLVETSGLAVPTAVLEALHSPALQERFMHDATLAIVDTPLLLAGVYDANGSPPDASTGTAASEVFQQQLMCADVVVLNKIDPCLEDDLLRAEAAIRTRASDVRFVELAWQARLDARLVLGLHLNESRAQVSRPGLPASTAEHAHGDGHTHSGLSTHEHGLLTHEHVHAEDPGWLSFVLRSQTSQRPDILHQALGLITAQEPVLRVKGFAHVRDAAGHLLVQGVRTRITCTMDTAGPGLQDHAHHHTRASSTMAELVFIGYHLNRDLVVAKLSEHTGTAWY